MKLIHLLVTIISVSYFILGCGVFSKNGNDNEIPTDIEMMATGNMELENGQYQDALNTYQSLIINHPISDLHIDAQLKIADTYGKMEDFESQMETLFILLRENIIPNKVPQIYVQIAKFYDEAATFNPGTVTSDTVDYRKAIEYYTKAYQYKDSDENTAKSEALYRRAMTEVRMGNITDAIAHYKLVETMYPESAYAILAGIKIQDPNDLSELSTNPDSLVAYTANQFSPTPEAMEVPAETTQSFEPEDTQVDDQPNIQPEEPEVETSTTDSTFFEDNSSDSSEEFVPADTDTSGMEM